MNESEFKAMVLRVAEEAYGAPVVDYAREQFLTLALATRIRDELCKGQEPVAEVRAANEAIQYPHLVRLVDVGQLPTGSKLYLHPAPIPEGMVLVPVWVLKTAQNLANHMAKKFYPEVAGFGVFDDLAGVISQIDNMVCGIPTEAMIAAYEGEKK